MCPNTYLALFFGGVRERLRGGVRERDRFPRAGGLRERDRELKLADLLTPLGELIVLTFGYFCCSNPRFQRIRLFCGRMLRKVSKIRVYISGE